MHLSIILLLTQVLSILALTVTTYTNPSCKGSHSVRQNVHYNRIYDGQVRSYRLSKDLERTDQLIFGDTGVEGEGRKNGCHDLGTEAQDFVLRSKAGALSSPDLGGGK